MFPAFIRYSSDKLQRLGLLKALVAVLHPHRRSESKDSLRRKLARILYEKNNEGHVRAELLMKSSESSSWNFRINIQDIDKLFDWGKLYGFFGSGNQITEQGILLRHLMGEKAIDAILGCKTKPNPFNLTFYEKCYFLFIHLEKDTPMFFLLKRIENFSKKKNNVAGIEADRLTCFAFYDTYKYFSDYRISSHTLMTRQKMRQLIGKMVQELNLSSEIPVSSSNVPRGPMRPRIGSPTKRRRTNVSDNEALPRFEFLTDLGLLTKTPGNESYINNLQARKMWQYWVTPQLLELVRRLPDELDNNFFVSNYAKTTAGLLNGSETIPFEECKQRNIASQAYNAYSIVKRQFGHTPLKSVAMISMIRALGEKRILEMNQVHNLFLKIKKENILPDIVRFAAGNAIDKMFIDIKPNFIEKTEDHFG